MVFRSPPPTNMASSKTGGSVTSPSVEETEARMIITRKRAQLATAKLRAELAAISIQEQHLDAEQAHLEATFSQSACSTQSRVAEWAEKTTELLGVERVSSPLIGQQPTQVPALGDQLHGAAGSGQGDLLDMGDPVATSAVTSRPMGDQWQSIRNPQFPEAGQSKDQQDCGISSAVITSLAERQWRPVKLDPRMGGHFKDTDPRTEGHQDNTKAGPRQDRGDPDPAIAGSSSMGNQRRHTRTAAGDFMAQVGSSTQRAADAHKELDGAAHRIGAAHIAEPDFTAQRASQWPAYYNAPQGTPSAFVDADRLADSIVSDTSSDKVSWMNSTRQSMRRKFTKKTLNKRLPIASWLPQYNGEKAVGDIIAGITVGLTVIPQSLAYSTIAGLPAQYGLYGSFVGCFIYIIFGSCRAVPMGPTAIASLMTFQAAGGSVEKSILLCFLSGVVELLMGVLGLGFLIDFVSGPVSSGFTSAVALIIATSQVKDILGITIEGTTFVQQWISIFKNIHNARVWDPILGVCCIVVLLLMRKIGMTKIGPSEAHLQSKKHKIVNKCLWMLGTCRNAIVVVVCGAIGFSFFVDGSDPPMKLMGYIPAGVPSLSVPPFSYVRTDNSTGGFVDMVTELGSGLLVVPLIALLEDIAVCKAFADGKTVDATQELIALGLSNIGNSFVGAYPGSGSLARSVVNNSSGVRTTMGGLYTGLMVILSLLFFTEYFAYIPKASLAAVIIAAIVFMVEFQVIKPMWRAKKTDLIPGIGTFVLCLSLQLEVGILIGIVVNIIFILYHAARPKFSVDTFKSEHGHEYLMITPDRCLMFPSVDYVRRLLTKFSSNNMPVVIDCTHIYGADYTAAKIIEQLTADFKARAQPLYFYNLKPSVCSMFEAVTKPEDFVVFYEDEDLDKLLSDDLGTHHSNGRTLSTGQA